MCKEMLAVSANPTWRRLGYFSCFLVFLARGTGQHLLASFTPWLSAPQTTDVSRTAPRGSRASCASRAPLPPLSNAIERARKSRFKKGGACL